jgi:hypothetical protein
MHAAYYIHIIYLYQIVEKSLWLLFIYLETDRLSSRNLVSYKSV